LEDPSEHRQCRDREGRCNKKCRIDTVSLRREGGRREVAECEADRKWQDETRSAHPQYGCSIGALCQVREVKCEPDLEHHEHEREIGEHLQWLRRCGAE